MRQTRRQFLSAAVATVGSITVLPYAARGQSGDAFTTAGGDITVHPVNHASFVMETPVGTIYADPVGEPSAYGSFPKADLILVTHEHGDHYKPETLAALVSEDTPIITNPAVFDMLPDDLKTKAIQIQNGGSSDFQGVRIDAIPAYNTTPDRLQFHPEGRDNGYVLG